MTPGLLAMLVGVFIVPALLVWTGHRLRRRPPAWRGAFWGALVGHVVATVLGLTFGMIPPEEWAATDHARGAFAFWSFLVMPIVGASVGWIRGRTSAISEKHGGDNFFPRP